jgi:hypothetical protein
MFGEWGWGAPQARESKKEIELKQYDRTGINGDWRGTVESMYYSVWVSILVQFDQF